MTSMGRIGVWSYLFMWLALSASASNETMEQARVLHVGVLENPPFVMMGPEGEYNGISMELWNRAAGASKLVCTYESAPLHDLLSGLESGRFDVLVGPLTLTATRERVFDFSHPYFQSGLGAAIHQARPVSLWKILASVLSGPFSQALALVFCTLFAGGILVWLAERKRNEEHFGGRWYQGLGAGLWWSATTISTVGYGDKLPRSLPGRAIGILWIFGGVLVISSFTAAVTTALTVRHFEASLKIPDDLGSVRTGVVADSYGAAHLRKLGIHPIDFRSLEEALEELASGRIDALVDDFPLLRSRIAQEYPGVLEVQPAFVEHEQYAFAFRQDSLYREPLNQAMLGVLESREWPEILVLHLGQQALTPRPRLAP